MCDEGGWLIEELAGKIIGCLDNCVTDGGCEFPWKLGGKIGGWNLLETILDADSEDVCVVGGPASIVSSKESVKREKIQWKSYI